MVKIGYNAVKTRIKDVNRLLTNKETTVKKIYEESSHRIRKSEVLNPFITVCDIDSRKKAEHLDDLLCHTPTVAQSNKLFGIPISVKDNFCTDQILTTCASKMLYNFVPNYNATAVAKLLEANCLMMGKTNMDEFAMGSSSVSSYFGPTASVFNSDRLSRKPKCDELEAAGHEDWFMAGGSSTGSAVSVASGSCFVSLGTDTGGSTRQPASLTGIVGFKPTYGLISRFGLIPLAHCLDVVSILSNNIENTKLVFDTIVGIDENDLTTVDHKKYLKSSMFEGKNRKKFRLGIPERFIADGKVNEDTTKAFNQMIDTLANCGSFSFKGMTIEIEPVSIDLPYSNLATECYTIICCAEIASNMSCYDGVKYGYATKLDPSEKFDRDKFFQSNRDEAFGNEVKKRILLGNYFLLEENREKYLHQAFRLRRCIYDEFTEAFDRVDIIITPSTPSSSISYQEWKRKQTDNLLFHEDYFLIPTNLANLPSISIPYGVSDCGLPMGLQLMSNRFCDLDLLYVSEFFEDILGKMIK